MYKSFIQKLFIYTVIKRILLIPVKSTGFILEKLSLEREMAVITQYVVQHKGVDKLVTTNKKEADQYDKMLEVADNISLYLQAKGIELEESVSEELSILMAKNKESVGKILRGTNVESLLEQESADIVEMKKA